jgi:hypothetical protein
MKSYTEFLEESLIKQLTLKYHNRLNPKIWKGDQLRDGFAEKLVEKAYEFASYSGVSKGRIKDIVITGGNVNYNYTKFSDIDVHLMCDVSGLDSDKLYEKKVSWTASHKNLKVAGYPIEFYAANDKDHFPNGQGVYSILENKWLIVPKHLDHVDVLRDPKVIDKINYYVKYIRTLLKSGTEAEIKAFKDKLHTMRGSGLHHGGEFSVENVVYKDLRNRGLLDKLNAKIHHKGEEV